MAFDIAQRSGTERPLTVRLTANGAEHSIALTYRPLALTTPVYQARARLAEADPTRGVELMAEAIGDVLASWDVTDGGQPYPTDVAALSRLDAGFLGIVLRAIGEDLPAALAAIRDGQPLAAGAPAVIDATATPLPEPHAEGERETATETATAPDLAAAIGG